MYLFKIRFPALPSTYPSTLPLLCWTFYRYSRHFELVFSNIPNWRKMVNNSYARSNSQHHVSIHRWFKIYFLLLKRYECVWFKLLEFIRYKYLTIYDMLGNIVSTLVSENQNSGSKSVQWDAKNNQGEPVSAGVYLYKIQAGDFSQTKKMIQLK